MIKFLMMMVVLMMSAGCVRSSALRIGPEQYAIQCKGNQTRCYERAAKTCKGEYKILNSANSTSDSFTTFNVNDGKASTFSMYSGEMLVQCLKPKKSVARTKPPVVIPETPVVQTPPPISTSPTISFNNEILIRCQLVSNKENPAAENTLEIQLEETNESN